MFDNLTSHHTAVRLLAVYYDSISSYITLNYSPLYDCIMFDRITLCHLKLTFDIPSYTISY